MSKKTCGALTGFCIHMRPPRECVSAEECHFKQIETPTSCGQVDSLVMCGLCKDCKHWDSDTSFDNGMGYCSNEKDFHCEYSKPNKHVKNNGAWIESDEGWCWVVAPNFGCIHFERST